MERYILGRQNKIYEKIAPLIQIYIYSCAELQLHRWILVPLVVKKTVNIKLAVCSGSLNELLVFLCDPDGL